jgi:UDP-N-acetylglucosamine--N-acetylmuramyl-(pentapeptide) pyrophosphoryl-undecaprenol N-acetylglucosamine transferase
MSRCVLIMAAGTGGHIFPALAIAKGLQQEGIRLAWLGTRQGMEMECAAQANIPVFSIDIAGLRGKRWLDWITAPFKLLRAFIQSKRVIASVKPDLILAMGGFVCGPGGVAAHLLKIPLVIHEQNAVAGLTNRLLANPKFIPLHRHSKIKALEAFPGSFPKNITALLTGNPVREDLLQLSPPQERLMLQGGRLKILVLGGSLGAQAINRVLPKAVARIAVDERPEIWHQTGKTHLEVTKKLYADYRVDANIVGFINDMASAYAWADLVICRAGAMTLAEICSVGVASMLVPFPHAVDDHQTQNATYLSKAHAAILVRQNNFNSEMLAEHLKSFSNDRVKLLSMARNAYTLRIGNATQQVVNQCRALMEFL